MVKIKKKPMKTPQAKFQKEARMQERDKVPLPSKSDSLLKSVKPKKKGY